MGVVFLQGLLRSGVVLGAEAVFAVGVAEDFLGEVPARFEIGAVGLHIRELWAEAQDGVGGVPVHDEARVPQRLFGEAVQKPLAKGGGPADFFELELVRAAEINFSVWVSPWRQTVQYGKGRR